MTSNDPRRRRSGDPRKHGGDGLAVVPASVSSLLAPPAGPGKAEHIGLAVAQALGEQLPLVLAQAFADVLARVPVRTAQHVCGPCVVAAVRWENDHARPIEAARQAQAAAAAQAAVSESQEPPPGILEFLPDTLKPGGRDAQPEIRPAITTIAGTDVCHAHLPGMEAPGRRQLLIAQSAFTSAMLADLAGQPG